MSGICSAHQGYWPGCPRCEAAPSLLDLPDRRVYDGLVAENTGPLPRRMRYVIAKGRVATGQNEVVVIKTSGNKYMQEAMLRLNTGVSDKVIPRRRVRTDGHED